MPTTELPKVFVANPNAKITVDEWGLADGDKFCVTVQGQTSLGAPTYAVLLANVELDVALQTAERIHAALVDAKSPAVWF